MANPITVSSPLPAQDLFFESMRYRGGLSTLGELELDLLSPKPGLDPLALLGQPLSVNVTLHDGSQRHFSGLVSRFGMGRDRPAGAAPTGAAAGQGRYYAYRARVVPWLWFLTRTADCRIFQEQTVPDIVKQVFADHDIASFEFKLFRSYRKLGYCVQYRESDFHFVARLLEHEGIYWYVEHGDGAHKLVLVDAMGAHDAAPGCPSLRYTEDLAQAPPDQEFVTRWRFAEGVKSGKVALTSYDFERPSTPLAVDAVRERDYPHADYEVFDFQGDYIQAADGSHYADNAADAFQTRFVRHHASANALGVEVGRRLKISKHPRDSINAEYLITDLDVHAQVAEHGAAQAVSRFDCEFDAIPAEQQFRPMRRARKPSVQGPQTAVVVGPAGEEIFTDKYGRVKVQFHWDRYGQRDEKSSCWVRVSQPWAGKNFGFMQIPRIGQEVVVDFLEGDPDQPLITGRIYNAEQMPPWDLPANATQSGVLSRSSQGGAYGNANALRFEDKKGAEQLWLHAEKNQDIEVENDETHWVGHDRSKTVDHDEQVHVKHDRTEVVDHDEQITVHHDRRERVDNDESIGIGRDRKMLIERDKTETVARDKGIHIGGSHSESVGGSMSVSVAGTLTESVGVNYAETVGGAMEITVGAVMAITVGGALAETVGGSKSASVGSGKSETIGGSLSVTVAKDVTESISGNRTVTVHKNLTQAVKGDQVVEVTKNASVKAKKIQLVADDEISLKTGSAEITMKKNGDITIKGNKITVKGDSDVILKGSKIAEN
ncbi:type VI secretion system Vgr family protein [Leptothrix cholodnii SP-6]|uniref:Type VI secretion system Vgr family protein n=1 Tax=Leptothrix cholodnii (strain ATCC 51168 / LMG 8142 / SP-6) TaxID=395495 RepID=B1XWY3_LEPCP|nr:type VI secretion system tip protein VgrG [Leptothrix cholodnii]ACB36332.1 type VI secretion system Vgr family protein [Leptothrix cholodnii SP-6]